MSPCECSGCVATMHIPMRHASPSHAVLAACALTPSHVIGRVVPRPDPFPPDESGAVQQGGVLETGDEVRGDSGERLVHP